MLFKKKTRYRTPRKFGLKDWLFLGLFTVLAPLLAILNYDRIRAALGGSNATPIAYWNFDEGVDNTCSGGSNDACDSSGNGRDVAFAATTAAPTWQTEDNCVSGKCIWLDGSNDHANTGNSPGLPTGNFTYSWWVRPNTSAGTMLMASDGSGGNELVISINSAQGSVIRIFLNDSAVLSSNQSIPANSWTHIAVTRNSGTLTIYINGKADVTGTAGATLGFSTCPLLIGVDADSGCSGTLGGFFHGYIDELKIYNTALSSSQVQAEFAGGSAVLGDSFDSNDFLNEGLAGYWPFDTTNDISQSGIDNSGNGTTLTNNSSTAYSTGKFGLAIEPDGTADYMEAADNATLSITGSLTLSAWINNDDTTGSQNIIGKWDGTNNSYLLALEGDELRMYIDSASNYQTTTSANLGSNSFVHVAGVYDANAQTVKLYVNGVEQASTTTGTIPSSIGDDAGEFVVGADDSSANFFDGHIDEARVYNRALPPNQIKSLYNWAPGPVAYYDFNEGSGSTAYDRSGNGINGTISTATYHAGKFGSALDFESAGHVQMTESDIHDLGLNNMTITAWVRRDGATTPFSNPMTIVSKRNSAGDGYDLRIDGNSNCDASANSLSGICIEIDEGADLYTISTNSTKLNDGQWHHISVTFDRETATNSIVYIDGIPQTTTRSGTLANIGSIANSNPLCIGKTSSSTSCVGTNNIMNGGIDEVKIYKYVRTQQQIVEDMNGGHPTGGSPIGSQVGYWKLDEMTGTTAYDRITQNGNNLTLMSSPTWTAGKINGAIDFESGSSQYLTAADSASLSLTSSLTLSAWIRPESTTAATEFAIASKGTAYQLVQYGDEIRMVIGGSSNYATTNNVNLQTGTWYHVLGVYDASAQTVKIYVNGTEHVSTVTGTIPSSISDGTDSFDVGRLISGTEQTFQVASTADDGLEIVSLSNWTNNNAQIAFGRFDGSGGVIHSGVRFNNVTIAQGATISNAYLQVFGNNTFSSNPTLVQGIIVGDDVDDAAAWDSSSRPSQITATSATVQWDPSTWVDDWNSSPAITSIIQEIVNRGGWSSGNDLRIAIRDDGSADPRAASFQDYSGNSSQAARLVVLTNATTSYYDGLIDEVQLFSSALTADQVKIVYNANSAVNIGTGYNANSNIVDGAGAPPVGFWPMDENTGTSTVVDKSSNSTNLSMNGSMTGDDWVAGKFGSALDFDGTNDYLQATDPNILDMGTSNFTISAWVWRDTDTTVDQIVDKRTAGDGTVCSNATHVGYDFLIWDTDHLSVSICDGTNGWEMYSSPGVVSTGSWHHVVAVVNRSSLSSSQLFLDGVPISDTKINDGSDPPAGNSISNSTNFRIATDLTGNYFWDGRLDNIQIYNYAQTPAQVAYDYNRGAPLFWYKMDDNVSGNGQTIANNAKNANGQATGSNGTTDDGANNTGMDCTVAGKRNGACDLDGTDDLISVTSPTLPTGDFTYAFWVNMDVANGTLFTSANSSGGNELHMSVNGANLLLLILNAGSADATTTQTIPTGQWLHITATRVAGAITLYVNGNVVASGTNSTVLDFANGGSFCNLYIGADADACTGSLGEYLDGKIDDFRIYGYALSAVQVRQVMNEGAVRFGPNEGSP